MATTYVTVIDGPLRRKLQSRGSNPAWTYLGELKLWVDITQADLGDPMHPLQFRNTLVSD